MDEAFEGRIVRSRNADRFSIAWFPVLLLLNRGSPREKVHIHVEKGDAEAKFWLEPEVRLAYNDGYEARTLRELLEIVVANRDRIKRAWDEFFG